MKLTCGCELNIDESSIVPCAQHVAFDGSYEWHTLFLGKNVIPLYVQIQGHELRTFVMLTKEELQYREKIKYLLKKHDDLINIPWYQKIWPF